MELLQSKVSERVGLWWRRTEPRMELQRNQRNPGSFPPVQSPRGEMRPERSKDVPPGQKTAKWTFPPNGCRFKVNLWLSTWTPLKGEKTEWSEREDLLGCRKTPSVWNVSSWHLAFVFIIQSNTSFARMIDVSSVLSVFFITLSTFVSLFLWTWLLRPDSWRGEEPFVSGRQSWKGCLL